MERKAVILVVRESQEESYEDQIGIFNKNGIDTELIAVDKSDKAFNDDSFYINALADADILYTAGNPPITRKVIENTPKLKFIQRRGIAYNSIDLEAATDCGKLVCNVIGYCVEELAVHATALILAYMRNITLYDSRIRAREWPKGHGQIPRRMSSLTVGLFGFGGSGVHMANIMGQGFKCKVIAYDPFALVENAAKSGVELVDFETLLEKSDIISIHAPLTSDTHHVFNAQAFGKMKPSAIITNVSRGSIIDEAALADALRTGKIAAAGIDVFEKEPLPASSELVEMPCKTVLTPHSAFEGKEALEEVKLLGATIPSHFFSRNVIYTKYVANPKVLDKFTGYALLDSPNTAL